MKVFKGSYYWYGNFGARQEYHCIIVANSESEALGFALTKYSNTEAKDWSFTEIDTTCAGCTEVSEDCN